MTNDAHQSKPSRRKFHPPGWTPKPDRKKNYSTPVWPKTHDKAAKLSRLLGLTQVAVLDQAVDQMIENLPQAQRDLYHALPD